MSTELGSTPHHSLTGALEHGWQGDWGPCHSSPEAVSLGVELNGGHSGGFQPPYEIPDALLCNWGLDPTWRAPATQDPGREGTSPHRWSKAPLLRGTRATQASTCWVYPTTVGSDSPETTKDETLLPLPATSSLGVEVRAGVG